MFKIDDARIRPAAAFAKQDIVVLVIAVAVQSVAVDIRLVLRPGFLLRAPRHIRRPVEKIIVLPQQRPLEICLVAQLLQIIFYAPALHRMLFHLIGIEKDRHRAEIFRCGYHKFQMEFCHGAKCFDDILLALVAALLPVDQLLEYVDAVVDVFHEQRPLPVPDQGIRPEIVVQPALQLAQKLELLRPSPIFFEHTHALLRITDYGSTPLEGAVDRHIILFQHIHCLVIHKKSPSTQIMIDSITQIATYSILCRRGIVYSTFFYSSFLALSIRYSCTLSSGFCKTSSRRQLRISPIRLPLGTPSAIRSFPVTASVFKEMHCFFSMIWS